MRVVITGGGTGGHLFPGLALAEEFASEEVLYIGNDPEKDFAAPAALGMLSVHYCRSGPCTSPSCCAPMHVDDLAQVPDLLEPVPEVS